MVGREDERRLLRLALERSVGGEPCAIVVHGEAGVGKTRLVREVVGEAATDHGVEVLWGTCVSFGASALPFAPLRAALRARLRDGDDATEPVRLLESIGTAATTWRSGRRPCWWSTTCSGPT